MRFMLLIHSDEKRFAMLPEAEVQAMMAAFRGLTEEMKTVRAYVASDRLQATSTATTVRVRDGKPLITDGPFAETKEQFCGYFVIEAKDLDEAIAWAGKVPVARYGSVEVRAVWA